tara:strand:+ start:4760 stop:5029 length:270 start_codon:yes stop_codon:yes gene_type:complete
MITEWLLDLFLSLMEWFASQLPTDDPPAFLSDVAGFVDEIAGMAAGLGAWVPWSYLGVVASSILILWLVLVSVKGLRWLWGLTPFSGGS